MLSKAAWEWSYLTEIMSEAASGTGGRVKTIAVECCEFWRSLPDKGVLLALFAVWLVFFQFLGNSTLGYVNTRSLFGWWYWVNTRGLDGVDAWQAVNRFLNADEAHVWFVPFVILGLLWWKRRELIAVPKRPGWSALVLFAVAILFHILGYITQQTRISLVAFFLGGYALTGLVWGGSWLRATFFPLFLLVFCIPLGNSTEYVTFPMRLVATRISTFLAQNFFGIDVIQKGTSILEPTGRFQYEVAPACSGIRSLTAILALATIYGFMQFPKNWQRLLLMGSALPLALIGNVIRLSTIIVAAEAFGQSAGDFVHENAIFSLLPYLPVIVGLMLLGRWLHRFKFAPRIELEARTA